LGLRFRVGAACGGALSSAFAGVSNPYAQSGARSYGIEGGFGGVTGAVATSAGGATGRRAS
jgi:hypothetical protein